MRLIAPMISARDKAERLLKRLAWMLNTLTYYATVEEIIAFSTATTYASCTLLCSQSLAISVLSQIRWWLFVSVLVADIL